ncbi:hypothetical protein GCM10009533_63380 [Saccharopolyspora spinosporotrichia]|uniref:Uncharacterized protein n=1 Tax=Saccharopolyspora erythraea TaxID=1836 RepID=A0ABP3NZQ8_SACER
MVGFAVELGEFALEVLAHRSHDLFHAVQVVSREDRISILRDENQVRVHEVDNVSTSAEARIDLH